MVPLPIGRHRQRPNAAASAAAPPAGLGSTRSQSTARLVPCRPGEHWQLNLKQLGAGCSAHCASGPLRVGPRQEAFAPSVAVRPSSAGAGESPMVLPIMSSRGTRGTGTGFRLPTEKARSVAGSARQPEHAAPLSAVCVRCCGHLFQRVRAPGDETHVLTDTCTQISDDKRALFPSAHAATSLSVSASGVSRGGRNLKAVTGWTRCCITTLHAAEREPPVCDAIKDCPGGSTRGGGARPGFRGAHGRASEEHRRAHASSDVPRLWAERTSNPMHWPPFRTPSEAIDVQSLRWVVWSEPAAGWQGGTSGAASCTFFWDHPGPTIPARAHTRTAAIKGSARDGAQAPPVRAAGRAALNLEPGAASLGRDLLPICDASGASLLADLVCGTALSTETRACSRRL